MNLDPLSSSLQAAAGKGAIPHALGVAVIYGAAIAASLAVSQEMGRVAAIWTASAILVALLLKTPRILWPGLFVITFAANVLVVSWMRDAPWQLLIGAALCHSLNAAMVAFPMQRFFNRHLDLARTGALWRFTFHAGLVAPGVTSILVALLMQATRGADFSDTALNWFMANALGMMIIVPALLVLNRETLSELKERQFETLLTFIGTAAATTLVFAQTRYPILITVLPVLMLPAYRLGFGGTALNLFICAFIGITFTLNGSGPLMLMRDGGMAERILMLQLFILVMMVLTFPVAAVLQQRKRLIAEFKDSQEKYRLLADNSNDIILSIGLDDRILYVSPATSDALKINADSLIGFYSHDCVHPNDRSVLDRIVEELAAGASKSVGAFRVRRGDGNYLWMEANARLVRNKQGKATGFVIVLRDIQSRVEQDHQRSLAYDRMEKLADIDGLTGIRNRRSFDLRLQEEWLRAERSKAPLGLLLLDVDHFKKFNDSYGHLEGDACLQKVAQTINSTAERAGDIVARYGGEEFIVLLPLSDAQAVAAVGERIRQAIEQLDIPHRQSEYGHVTASIGGVSIIPTWESPETLVAEADKALYEAKKAGRNKVDVRGASQRRDTAPHPAFARHRH